ncbi:hypothetical protein L210DRAFT_986300 [Boletus edulis BED1]|uniref:Uncharacterized protein n=1 Tax=Boletus edulis BED1 TaxID=1328754 RepID=A0AAD4GGY7_BOLED|nr:hypothetical protein L210DRAFT_986300 [Boletus edulis BED1]
MLQSRIVDEDTAARRPRQPRRSSPIQSSPPHRLLLSHHHRHIVDKDAVSTQHNQLGTMQDLNEAIILGRDALEHLTKGHPDRSLSLNNLAAVLSTWYNQPGHPHRSESLDNLAGYIRSWFARSELFQDQEEPFNLYS